MDESDGDLRIFLGYLVAAVHAIKVDTCQATQELLQMADLPPVPLIAASLINDLDLID